VKKMDDLTALSVVFFLGLLVGFIASGQPTQFAMVSNKQGIAYTLSANSALC
jgi:hypothetical protein